MLTPESKTVAGYYTLSQYALDLVQLPAETVKKLPRYPEVPTTLLGRLAVTARFRGQSWESFSCLMPSIAAYNKAARWSLPQSSWMRKMNQRSASMSILNLCPYLAFRIVYFFPCRPSTIYFGMPKSSSAILKLDFPLPLVPRQVASHPVRELKCNAFIKRDWRWEQTPTFSCDPAQLVAH